MITFWLLISLLYPLVSQAAELDIVINEIAWMGTNASSSDEWIELYNPGNSEIDLTNWTITAEDNTPNITLSGNIPNKGYFLLERTADNTIANINADQIYTGALENGGEVLSLKNASQEIIDQVSSWYAGDNSNKASMERISSSVSGDEPSNWQDGSSTSVAVDTDGNNIVGTPGQANTSGTTATGSTEPVATGSTEPTIATAQVGEVVINEFVYSGNEWLELYNKSSANFDLSGWTINDGVTKRLDLSGVLNSLSWLAFNFSASVLNNSGDIIILKNSSGEVIDQISYGNWDDGNQADNASLLSGDQVSLIRYPDGADTDVDASDWQATNISSKGLANIATEQTTEQNYSHQIFINELLPDPDGSDSQSEWIEIFNNENESIDLSSWQLDDDEDGSSPYSIPEGTTIEAKGYLVFSIRTTGLSLKNSGDNARLITPSGEVVKNVEYHNAPKNQVWAREVGNNFKWSTTHTPGQPNIFTELKKATKVAGVADMSKTLTDIKDIKNYADNTIIKTRGKISAPSNLLGKGVAYLYGSGIKIYWRGHNLPPSQVGDFVEVVGRLDNYLGERIIKPSLASDFKVLAKHKTPKPKTVKISVIGENLEGSLLTVSGVVTKTSGKTFYLSENEATLKIVIQDSTKINKPPTPRGSYLTVTGVLSQTKTGYRLLPRFQDDITLTGSLPQTGTHALPALAVSTLGWYWLRRLL